MNGDRAPVSGSSPSFNLFREDALDPGNSGKVAFGAGVSASTVGDGWFVGSSPADLSPHLLGTQELSNNIRIKAFYIGKRGAAVSDSGELAAYVSDINGSDIKPRILIGGPNGAFRTFALNGDKAGEHRQRVR